MILLLIFLPIFAIFLNLSLNNILLLYSKRKVQNKCRIQAFKAQNEIIKGFNLLTSLNLQAKRLRARKRSAVRAVKYALDPRAKAAAAAYLAFVTSQQLAFKLKQQKIIINSKSKAKYEMLKAPGRSGFNSPPFALEARPVLSLSPSYYAPKDLTTKQELIISWKVKNSLNQSIVGQCGSYVKTFQQNFIAKLSYLDT